MAKAHSAADWSTRPLPEPWLNYAALDVELLLELRVRLVAQLAERGRTEWARQEFEYVRTLGPAPPRHRALAAGEGPADPLPARVGHRPRSVGRAR